MCTSAGWAEALVAITAEGECDGGNTDLGNLGNCGNYMAGVAFMIAYLVLSFLIIVNMYIAVILENYSQVSIFNNFKKELCLTAYLRFFLLSRKTQLIIMTDNCSKSLICRSRVLIKI